MLISPIIIYGSEMVLTDQVFDVMSPLIVIKRSISILHKLAAVVRESLLDLGHLLSATLLQLLLLSYCLIVLPLQLPIIGPVLLILGNYI
jgi:hypothetical protein